MSKTSYLFGRRRTIVGGRDVYFPVRHFPLESNEISENEDGHFHRVLIASSQRVRRSHSLTSNSNSPVQM